MRSARRIAGVGVLRGELAVDWRMMPHANYLIFYREEDDHVLIERILNSAPDVGVLMGE